MNKKAFLFVTFLSCCMIQAKAGSPIALKENYNGHGYEYVTTPLVWEQARKNAEKSGGYLVCITSDEENKFLIQFIKKATDQEIPATWIGLNDDKIEGDWKWLTGEPTTFTFWFQGEPNNAYFENKVVYEKREQDIRWNDASSDRRHFYIIEYDHEIENGDKNERSNTRSNLRSTR